MHSSVPAAQSLFWTWANFRDGLRNLSEGMEEDREEALVLFFFCSLSVDFSDT